MDVEIRKRLYQSISTGDVTLVRDILTKHPEYRDPNPDVPDPNMRDIYWLKLAIRNNRINVVSALLELGYNINAVAMPEEVTPLIGSIDTANLEMIKLLLTRGADATIGRTFFAAINRDTEKCDDSERLEIVKLLVKHGADINREFNWLGNDNIRVTPLSYAISSGKQPIAEYLKSLDAKMPLNEKKSSKDQRSRGVSKTGERGIMAISVSCEACGREYQVKEELAGKRVKCKDCGAVISIPLEVVEVVEEAEDSSTAEEVVDFFQQNFGTVHDKSLIEVVPTTDPPITIHAISPTKARNHITLFTAGMSDRPMTVPDGEEEYQFAELFIQLPADWPLAKKALADPNFGWPIHWLRQVAGYPHANNTWLGGPVTIIANGEPPERLAPKCPFTSLLIMVGHSFTTDDGRTIQLYRLLPLYSEERALEMSQGVAELMRRFDKHDISTTVDLKRVNVALKSKK